MNKIAIMLSLQQQLNDATNGEGWEKGITKNGKLIDWRRCAYLECAELIESYPWKHWKNINADPDHENIKIEAVDIWHFVMSELLREYKIDNIGRIDDLALLIETLPNYTAFTQEVKSSTRDYYEQIGVVEDLIRALMCQKSTAMIAERFIDVAIQSDLNLDTLYRLYVGKNILNQFRQDHGYKEGSYSKSWDGEEDNAVMQRILGSNPEMAPNELYRVLEANYPKP